jgi:small subunit ribosomal protein S6
MTDNNETTIDSRVYEISFIFDNKLDEGTALKKAETLKQTIATLGGSFISEEAPYMRELAYEMIRVQSNINVRFNEGYFGWIKFELGGEKVKELEKGIKLDEEVVRHLVVRTVAENTVFTKRAPVIKAEALALNEDGSTDEAVAALVNIDTTKDIEVVPEVVAEVALEIPVEIVASEEAK